MQKDILKLISKNKKQMTIFKEKLEKINFQDKEIIGYIKNLDKEAFYKKLYTYEYNSLEFREYGSLFDTLEEMSEKELIFLNILKQLNKKNKINEKGVKVGDIFYTKFGYENTRVEFYQVISTTEKSFFCQEISQKESVFGYDCGTTKPKINKFVYNKDMIKINNKHLSFTREGFKYHLSKYAKNQELHFSNNY
ncbi:hypothetical protein [Campylobacter volucris]|uniref:hypothetical protein n=1 Tax=Campylobacter volucris TaxID=1031542 RepID=UPI0018A0D4F6|nr:hypothetical protein [Campylobacter volucris]MBF7048145.1 hypothetical protein [Campylobacter volucris]